MEIAVRRVPREKKYPRVSTKTYHWDDLRKSRRRGGYPWTHLYKEPFNEPLDPEPWTMEGMRKSKISSAKSEQFSISTVSTFDNQSVVEDNPSIDTKDKNHSIKTSCSSLNLEEQEIEEDVDILIEGQYEVIDKDDEEEFKKSPGMFFLHSEESSDDISQYLDREERCPSVKPINNKKEDHLKPEDDLTNRKRKLSAESSSSKLSQGKKAILQKLKETKEKIKIPKISFSTKLKKPSVSTKKLKNSPPEVKKHVPKSEIKHRTTNAKPVYIHIPLKPPSGETDEFSYLENEPVENQPPAKKPSSFRDLVKTMKYLQEPKAEEKHPSPIRELDEEEEKDNNFKTLTSNNEVKSVENIEPTDNDNLDESVEIVEISSSEEMDAKTAAPNEDFFEKLFEASASRPRTDSKNYDRKLRSKSAEPERKRKLSLESSYSRKSLSKLGFLKKLRDAKDKLTNKLSRVSSKKDIKLKEEPAKMVEKLKTKPKPQKHVEPVYIHIPLKPAKGKTDEFSHLEFEAKPIEQGVTEATVDTAESPIESPRDVQFLMLTAPSDDEILDYPSSDVPETPSSENKLFFPVKLHELKEIAKGAVDEVAGTTTSNKLSSVVEEIVSVKGSIEDLRKNVSVEEKMIVDEEDGLNETMKQDTLTEEVKIVIRDIEQQKEKIEENKQVKEKLKSKEDIETVSEAHKKNNSNDAENNVEKVALDIQEIERTVTIVETQKDEEPMADIHKQPEGTNEATRPGESEKELDLQADMERTTDESVELKSVLKSPNSPVMKKKVSFRRKVKSTSDSYDEQDVEDETNGKDITGELRDEKDLKYLEKFEDKDSSEWSKTSDHDQDAAQLPPSNNFELPTVTLNNTQAVVITTETAMGQEPVSYDFTTKHVYEEIAEGSGKTIKSQVFASTTDSKSSENSDKPKEGPSKFQLAFKQKADNLKSRFKNIKKPHISLPERPKIHKPNLQRFKIEKPKWNMPKIPDTAKINLPFSLPRKKVKRISSTESTSGDSKKPIFDFGTYPRIFKKKSKSDFNTVPRAKKSETSKSTEDSRVSSRSTTDSIRIPLHSEDSTEKDEFNVPEDMNVPSHLRYSENIDSEDEYLKENKEIKDERDFLSRWQRGRFNPDELIQQQPIVTDLDSPDKEFSSSNGKDQHYSSGSSVGVHRQGVLEEINPDEFFLRQKGISQDDIEVGMYLSTEIREAFRNPTNALVQMEENNFDKGSHHSLPELQVKKKPIRKPKRKKTPHASQEKIPYDEEETADEELDIAPPSRPKRHSKRKKKTVEEFIIPYQETIQVASSDERLNQHRESLGILGDDEQEYMYENEHMKNIEQPEIKITNPYYDYGEDEFEEQQVEDIIPIAPPRAKPKIEKSIQMFEAGSAAQTFECVKIISGTEKVPKRISYHTKNIEPSESYPLNITEPEFVSRTSIENAEDFVKEFDDDFHNYRFADGSIEQLPPAAPPRKQKSVKSLTISENEYLPEDLNANKARFSSEKNLNEPQIDAIRTESKVIIPIEPEKLIMPIELEKPPVRPTRSRASSKSRGASESRGTSQLDLDNMSIHEDNLEQEAPVPCVEEPFVKEPCIEEPCVQVICDYMGYSTVDRNKPRDPPLPPPRSLQRRKRSKQGQENKFSTVPRSKITRDDDDKPVRPLRIYSTLGPSQKEDKENLDIDILQYIEQDDNNMNRDLQSGEVIEMIKSRPLPAPPRPPRQKGKPLSDITSKENIFKTSTENLQKEIEVYTQTEPLPDDFVCEEVVEEPTDRVIMPTQTTNKPRVKRELITPTVFTHQETITHASLLVEPLDGAKVVPDFELSQERIIPVHVESDIDETSSIPEEFHKLAEPKIQSQAMDVLKAHKLQVTDLDVDTLTVNKLLADKIVVSEIDSSSIQTNEISSKTGALSVGEISLPPEVLDQIIRTLQSREETKTAKEEIAKQKKTPIESSSSIEECISTPLTQSQINEKVSETVGVENKNTVISSVIPDKESNSVSLEDNIVTPIEEYPVPLKEDTTRLDEHPTVLEEFPEPLEECPEPLEECPEPLECLEPLECPEPLEECPEPLEKYAYPSDGVDISPVSPVNEQPSEKIDQISLEEGPPPRPPRQSERLKPSQSNTEVSVQEPDVDDDPPPRPPQPPAGYIPSQPPSSFYALRAQKYVDDNIPAVPRRRRHVKSKPLTRSSSEESLDVIHVRRLHRRSSEPSIGQLSGQLVRACGSEVNNALKRLITYILNNVFNNEDGKQDLNVMIIIILVLIAGLLLLGYGQERTVVHLHHWEYFNPPKDL